MGGCSAPDCRNKSRKGMRTFKFPCDPKRRAVWLANTNRKDLPVNATLCEVHFDSNQFERHREDGWKKLKPNAVPTIFKPSPSVKIKLPKKRISKKTVRPQADATSTSLPDEAESSQGSFEKLDDVENESDFVPVLFGQRRCCVCYKRVKIADCVALAQEDGTLSDFGSVMCAVLRMSQSSFLTQYCCTECSDQVLHCFKLLIDINVSAMLTNRRRTKELSEIDMLDNGCKFCPSVYPNIEEFTNHFMQHVLSGDLEKEKANEKDPLSIVGTKTENGEADDSFITKGDMSMKEENEPIVLMYKNDSCDLVKEEHGYTKKRRTRVECSRVCHHCGKTFKSRLTMLRHMKRHLDPEFPRQRTGRRTANKVEEKDNDSAENVTTTCLMCSECGDVFNEGCVLKDHTALIHHENVNMDAVGENMPENAGENIPVVDENILVVGEKQRQWCCGVCGCGFPSRQKCLGHMRDTHADRCYCQLCGKWFRTKDHLQRHNKRVHLNPAPCSECGQVLASKRALLKHKRDKHNQHAAGINEERRAAATVEKVEVEGMAGVVNHMGQVIFNIPVQFQQIIDTSE